MFGLTFTNATPKRDIDAFAKKVGLNVIKRDLKIRSFWKEWRINTLSKVWAPYQRHWSSKASLLLLMQIEE